MDNFSAGNSGQVINKTNFDNYLYADILETIDLGIVILSIKRQEVLFKNKSYSEIFHNDKDVLEYKGLLDLLLSHHGKNQPSEVFGKHFTLKYKNRLLGYTAYMVSDNYIWIIIRDITERSRLETIAETVNSMENISYIFSGIRHELGNPINSIKMTLSVLKKNLGEYSPTAVEKFVDRAMTEITRVEFLLQALKSFSIFENPDIQNIKLVDFIIRFISLVGNDLHQSGITINKVIDHDVERVNADSRLLHQIMLNLITNATDALENKDNPEIIIRAKTKDGLVAITVEDNGCGMSEEVQANLFKPFYTTKARGTGLGLMITLKMVTLLKGSMEIKSVKDTGTKVTVVIPEGKTDD